MTPNIQPREHPRRGALLLVVLSMLILFLMLGTVLVTHATRSRTAAASFANAVSASSNPARIANEVLDEALMQLIRGKPAPNTSDFNDESLLADKYSALSAKKGSATITSKNLLVTVTFTPDDGVWNIDDDGDGATDRGATYLDAGGRILTFLPTPEQVGTRSSYRILRAEPANASDPTSFPFTFYLENNRPEISAVLPTTNVPVEVVVNNREFPASMAFAEPYDSFQQDKWLTQYSLSGTSATQPIIIERTAFQKAATAAPEVDNDGDGVLDSEWRNVAWKNTVFPNRTLPNGDTLEFQVSYLVHDLDSRFNVNAHGSLDYAKKAPNSWTTPSDWGTVPQEITDEQIEPGFGWGVADIHLPFTTGTDDRALAQRISQGMASATGTSAFPAFFRETRLPSVDGRYGWGPGATAAPPVGSPSYDELQQRTAYNNNKLVDLKSLMMVFVDTTQTPPELNYRVPADYVSAANLLADPYELAINGTSPRINAYGNGGSSNANSLFSLSELERVLRQYDADATTLPQRLASILGSRASDLRMLVTTDSWDTPAMTGGVYKRVSGAFRSLNLAPSLLYELLSPDVAAGLRFDINRPFDIADETRSKLDYCRHFYCLLMALEFGDLNQSLDQSRCKRIAQWVVNTIDYRDDDSQSTQFRFDTDLRDGWGDATDMTGLGEGQGWNSTSNVVQGNEKTYLAVAETFAWYEVPNHADNSGLFVSLYRPAEETITFPGSSIAPIPTGQLDDSLKGPNDELDICKKNSNGDPVWRLRYTDSDNNDFFVRFDLVTSALKAPFDDLNTSYRDASTLDKDGNPQTFTSLELAADGFICVYPSQDVSKVTLAHNQASPNVFKTLAVDKGKKMGFLGANSSGNYSVHLERLATPSADWDGSNNPYITINSFDVKPVPKNGEGKQSNGKSYRRCQYHFWKTPGKFENQFEGNLGPLPRNGRGFLSWPNRPFISQTELALVPPGTPSEILDGDTMLAIGDRPYHYLSGDNNESLFTHPEWVLQATHVPSRFRGTAQSFDNTNALVIPELRKLGMELVPYRQLSRLREPGRINLNTLPMTDYGSNALARAVIGNIKSQTVFPLEETTDSPPLMRLNNPFSPAGWAKTVSRRSGSALTDSSSLLGLGNEGLYFDSVEASVGNRGGNGGGNSTCNGNCGPSDAPTDQRDYFPLLGLRTAIRLGNVATIRSNVFAVWITARVTNTTTGVETTRRLFAIVDRSIPVAFSPGEDLNSRDIIRVKRYLE